MWLNITAVVLLGLSFALSVTTADNAVSVYTGHDDDLCEKPSTSTITEGGCNETELGCTAFQVGASGTTTYYGQRVCAESRDSYLQATFGNSQLFLVEYFEDNSCNKLKKTEVYLADGACHYFTLGTMKVWTAADNSMAALTVSGNCDSNDWSVFMSMNASVNTGDCVSSLNAASARYFLGENIQTGPPVPTSMPTPIPADFPNKVSVSIGNDDSSCEKPSTARIREGGCSDGDVFGCTAYERIGGWSNVTYYGLGTCSHSREDYLKSAFKNSEIFMIEHYQDVKCSKLESTEVYRADGECHFFTLGVMKIWVAQDKSMAALLTSSHCENDNWNVALDLNVSVNTGACIPDNGSSNRAVKYVYIDGSDTLSTRAPSNYGRSLWPVRDGSLCVHEFVDPNVCRGFKAGLNLLEMSNQFFQYEQWMTSFLPHNDYYGKIPMLPDRFLQYLFPVNRWVFNLWKTACTQTYNPARPQELADCQCAHEQLIRGISAARRIQHITGRYDLDSEWCDLLRKRDQILYQGSGSSVLLDLCDQNIGVHLNDQRRALLDSILC